MIAIRFPFMDARGSWLWLGALALALATGCGRNDVQVYRVAKETPPAQPPAGAAAQPSETSSANPKLQWKLPAGWKEIPAGEMRAASFTVAGNGKQADVGIVPLPGLAGGDLNNVNRWRDQVGQPHITEAELAKLAQSVEIAGQPAQLFEQVGQNPSSGDQTRILAAVLRRDGVAWFFKMIGDDGLVAQQKPAFIDFLKSIAFSAGSAQPELPPSHPPIGGAGQPELPPSHPPIGGSMSAQPGLAAASSPDKPQWQVPAGWQEVPGGQFLVAKFQLAGADNAQAAVNVSMSANDGGGVLANVNRWRTQLGLAGFAEADLTKQLQTLDVPGSKAILIDMTGTDARTSQPARLVGAVVTQPQRTWFYKLMGNAQIVEREKAAFVKFLQTTKYHE